MIKELKRQFRTKLLKSLKEQKEVDRLTKSFKIQQKLFSLPEFIKAKVILFYLSFAGEVETHRMVDKAVSQGKKVAVPIINNKNKKMIPSLMTDYGCELEVGPYSIFQPKSRHIKPVAPNKIDLIIVPAVAYDRKGNRLGRGLGYYDRFLNSLPRRTKTVGLAFDFQVLSDLPFLEPHDFGVDKVLSA
ncbi:5-formyltetrahydrofolate cyclo-ligase family protein [uncultured archaeon]|nr:5-formyltetrahydrofolate cyclo-ligase family protein [uncultured archaeon]